MWNRAVVVVFLFVIASVGVAGQSLFEPKRDPYRNLFGPPARVRTVQPRADVLSRVVPAKPTVVCGTVIVPADPSVDPKIRAPLPRNNQTFTMRSITPPVCKP